MSGERRGGLWPLSIAPMVDCTDRHFRYFLRRLTRRTLLYTEMIATRAVLDDPTRRYLAHHEQERPLVVQLGGDDPDELAACARIAGEVGFAEVNLNVGCPSQRVQQGRFGACLMADPERVADCVAAMRAATHLPVTVKHRIGIDDLDRYEDLARFVSIVAGAGCDRFTVHARIALLGGLSPKQNRSVPPLRYDDVYRLKVDFPEQLVELNGGIVSLDQVEAELPRVDGVMIGRAAYDDPFLLRDVDRRLYGAAASGQVTRRQVIEEMLPYVEVWVGRGLRPHAITRHMIGLFAGRRGARAWRRHLGERASRPGADASVLREAMSLVSDEILDE